MAAGLSLKPMPLASLKQAYDKAVREILKPEQLTGEILSDGELPVALMNLDIAYLLRDAGPWGKHLKRHYLMVISVSFNSALSVKSTLKLVLESQCGAVMMDAIAFNVDLTTWPDASIKHARVAYKLDVNEFRGNQTVQMLVDYIEPA
ncbi:hypothetical protein AB6C80_023410 [Vibrio cyclitrophicus]